MRYFSLSKAHLKRSLARCGDELGLMRYGETRVRKSVRVLSWSHPDKEARFAEHRPQLVPQLCKLCALFHPDTFLLAALTLLFGGFFTPPKRSAAASLQGLKKLRTTPNQSAPKSKDKQPITFAE